MRKRSEQAVDWMWQMIDEELQHSFREHPAVRDAMAATSAQVARGEVSASGAAAQLLGLFKKD